MRATKNKNLKGRKRGINTFKSKSKIYKALSSTCGFTDRQIGNLIGINLNCSSKLLQERLNEFFYYEKDYMTLNIVEIIGEVLVKKGLFKKNDDAVSWILFAVDINRKKVMPMWLTENNRIIDFALGKMLDRKTKKYKNQIDTINSISNKVDFNPPKFDDFDVSNLDAPSE